MDQIIWKIKVKNGVCLEKGLYVTCLWNREKKKYEVCLKGQLCGTVILPRWENRTTPDSVMGEVIESGRTHARIRIGRNRACSRYFVVNRLFLPIGAETAA